MNPLDKYIQLIEKEFAKYLSVDFDKEIYFKNADGIFKNDTTFCYIELADTHHITGQVFVSVFRSNGNYFEEVQNDYLDHSVTFSFDDIESFAHWINAIF